VERRPFGNRPAFQHTVHLQTEVVMQAGSGVTLNDENKFIIRFFLLAFGFAGLVELSFVLIFFECHNQDAFWDLLFFRLSRSFSIRSMTFPSGWASVFLTLTDFPLAFLLMIFINSFE